MKALALLLASLSLLGCNPAFDRPPLLTDRGGAARGCARAVAVADVAVPARLGRGMSGTGRGGAAEQGRRPPECDFRTATNCRVPATEA